MSDLDRLIAALADRYRVIEELGRGGMATVYKAEDRKHRREVAVKVLHPELGEVLGKERFLREIETAARLSHPHILPVHDSGEADGLLFYVMPLAEDESLRERLDREKQLPIDDALRISPAKWPTPCPTPTHTTWCTVTSSQRTCCSRAVTRWWPISASPRR